MSGGSQGGGRPPLPEEVAGGDRREELSGTGEAGRPSGSGTVHPGRAPRLRRVGRTAAVVVVVGFLGVLAVLTARYPHDFSAEREEGEEARPPSRTAPLSAERIEEYARQRLEDELRARKPAPAPPELDLPEPWGSPGPEALRGSGSAAPDWPPPPPPPVAPAPVRLSAIASPLSPAGSGGGGRVPASAGGGLRERPEAAAPLEALRQRLERSIPADAGGPTLPAVPGSAGARGAEALTVDDRRLELPSIGPLRLEPGVGPGPGRRAGVSPRLAAGVVVPLVLTHDVGTDVPGPVRAWVARDVYDSATHSVVVIPRGTVVVGSQAARASVGDRRVLLAWRRLTLPSGVVYELPELPAGSADGTAGARAEVDRHWWGRFGNAVALSLVGAGAQLSQPQERSAVQGFAPSEGQVVAQQLGLELGRLSQEILRRGIDRPPTLTLSAGQRLSLLVSRDLVFPGPGVAMSR